ncbi:acylphosphatase [Fontivita pretiosa]|uniref:acylphosphatase n=1 Tax=Fontivita pretiosa TaxID=2989684 RepID=UPI003D180816
MNRRTVYYSGHVQGVGFRYTAENLARRYAVSGYVRNLPDGRVELVMEGPDDQMDMLMAAIQQRMGQYIRKTTVQTSPATGEFSGFTIRH